ncbi:DNA/RNA-binding winged helix domain-containing protein, partial [Pseudomonas otitidis]
DELGPDRDRLRRYALSELERPVFIALLEQLMVREAVQQAVFQGLPADAGEQPGAEAGVDLQGVGRQLPA